MSTLNAVPLGQSVAHPDFSWACASEGAPRDFASLVGTSFGGAYEDARRWMTAQAAEASAFVVIFTRPDGMEAFLASLPSEVTSRPMAGGASAREGTKGETYPTADDVAVFAIQEGQWNAVSVVAHREIGQPVRCAGHDARSFDRVKTAEGDQNALEFLAEVRREYGIAGNDWDRVALVTDKGTVLHLHPEGERVACGADLPASRTVRAAIFDEKQGSRDILAAITPGTLAFGCAGLRGLFDSARPWEKEVPTTYLYGELATLQARPVFANLTFSLLQRVS